MASMLALRNLSRVRGANLPCVLVNSSVSIGRGVLPKLRKADSRIGNAPRRRFNLECIQGLVNQFGGASYRRPPRARRLYS